MTSQQNQRKLSLTPQLFPIQSKTVKENSLQNISPDPVESTLPRLDLPRAPFDSKLEDREEIAESLCTDGTALEIREEHEESTPYTP